jgi:ABC-type dipeptide/oligopeptide/nickel transport system permease subunit
LLSPSFVYSVANDISINVVFDEKTKDASSYSPNYDVQLLADFDNSSAYASSIELQGYSTNYDPLTLSAIQNTVKTSAAYIAAGKPSAFNACLLFNVKAETNQPSLYIKTISVKAPEDDTTDYSMVAFSDATKMLSGTNPYTIHGSATLNVYGSKVILGDFRYDYYEAAFGKDDYVFDSGMIDDFYKKGYLTTNYPWGAHTTSGDFEPDANFLKNFLTDAGKQYCPLQEITTERITAFRGEITGRSLVGKRSLYRYDYYKGLINKCEYPQYFFGTNSNGQDFFKIVFSGLSTSLLLGLLTAVINFSVGLIWGSISGYFGGWTDIIMERFTEILGGMPWIVMFTLIVLLLGSNFQTFLLALCLTGWMGMAGETREQFYRFKGREYVLASRTLGASDWRLIFRHILPNGIGTIITSAAFMIPGVIFSEASISYLLPSTLAFSGSKSFGVTLSQAQADIHQYPYLIVSASIIMVLLMISFNLFANGLRDAFNPSLKGSDN